MFFERRSLKSVEKSVKAKIPRDLSRADAARLSARSEAFEGAAQTGRMAIDQELLRGKRIAAKFWRRDSITYKSSHQSSW